MTSGVFLEEKRENDRDIKKGGQDFRYEICDSSTSASSKVSYRQLFNRSGFSSDPDSLAEKLFSMPSMGHGKVGIRALESSFKLSVD
jgi:hypothetical protein